MEAESQDLTAKLEKIDAECEEAKVKIAATSVYITKLQSGDLDDDCSKIQAELLKARQETESITMAIASKEFEIKQLD